MKKLNYADMSKQDYIQSIVDMMEKCSDITLLHLILVLLEKSI